MYVHTYIPLRGERQYEVNENETESNRVRGCGYILVHTCIYHLSQAYTFYPLKRGRLRITVGVRAARLSVQRHTDTTIARGSVQGAQLCTGLYLFPRRECHNDTASVVAAQLSRQRRANITYNDSQRGCVAWRTGLTATFEHQLH